MSFQENDKISSEESPSTTFFGGFNSRKTLKPAIMPTNPLKKLHEKLLSKEKNRKDTFTKLAKRLKFWQKDDNKEKKHEEETLKEEDQASSNQESQNSRKNAGQKNSIEQANNFNIT